MSTITADELVSNMRTLMREFGAEDELVPLKTIFTHTALVPTDERLFPASRHRSMRVRRKLIKRFGGEYRMKPAIYQFGKTVFAHPSFRGALTPQ